MIFNRKEIISFILIYLTISLVQSQINILPSRDTPPPDLSIENSTYSTPLNFPYPTDYNDCAEIYSIEKTADGNFYKILIDVQLNGKGCKKVFPWSIAPEQPGQVVFGKDALMTCNTNDITSSCIPINSGFAGGISLSLDPPIYSFPMNVPVNSPQIPFGYAGYFAYDYQQKGSCSDYYYVNKNPQMSTTVNKISHKGIYLNFPSSSKCSKLPSQNSFLSSFSAKQIAQRLFNYNYYQVLPQDFYLNLSSVENKTLDYLMPIYGYNNASLILGIVDPFICNANNSLLTGALPSEIFSCPMTVQEWEAILPDVALLNQTIDLLVGPNITSYNNFARDGQWIPPKVNLNTVPVGFGRCSYPRDSQAGLQSYGVNYASTHHPINLVHGPTCTALRVLNSHVTAKVSFGGFVGISATSDPFSGLWTLSAGFPVRNLNQVGNTERVAEYTAPGTSASMMSSKFDTTSGTNGDSLLIDMDSLRYVLCNGLSGSVTSAGYNLSSGLYLGPLVSTKRKFTDETPIWANPFRYTSSVVNNSDCTGCTFPTIRSQKGWTIFDALIWTNSLGSECGKYQTDHSLWSRILAAVNHTQFQNLIDNNLFAVWNSTSSRVDFFLQNANALNLNLVNDNLPKLLNNFIPGVGVADWVKLIGDIDRHACRPSPYPYQTNVNNGQQAIPLCSLLQRQLYYQSFALNNTLTQEYGLPTTIPDLQSADKTGIFNLAAPNIWFGIQQRDELEGNSQWYVYLEDTYDRTGNSKFENDGIAQNVTGLLEIMVPVSTVQIPFVKKRYNNIQHLQYSIPQASCYVVEPYTNPSLAASATIQLDLQFGSPHSFINYVILDLTPVFAGENNNVKFNYDTTGITVNIIYENGNIIPNTNFITNVINNTISISLPYQTVYNLYVYRIYIPIIVGSISTSVLPIIQIESSYQMTDQNLNTQIIYLQNTATINNFGCNYHDEYYPKSIALYEYNCNDDQLCFSNFNYINSNDVILEESCASSSICPPSSISTTQFYLNTCGFGVPNISQSFDSSIHFYYDGSSIDFNLIGHLVKLNLNNIFEIQNCGFGSYFDSQNFFVSVCGYVGNSITGATKTIPCDNSVLLFSNNYNQNIEFETSITWFQNYNTLIKIIIVENVFDLIIEQNENWFVDNSNIDICEKFGPMNVFCNYASKNTIFSLNFILHFPFVCNDYDLNSRVNQNIIINSQLITSINMVNEISLLKYQIIDRNPILFICSNNNVSNIDTYQTPVYNLNYLVNQQIYDPINTDQTNEQIQISDLINSDIQGLLPPCAVDFANIYARPGLLPLNSYCYPYLNESYTILPNCSIVLNGDIIPEIPLNNMPIYRNVYNVYSNFSDFITWFCQIIPGPIQNRTTIYNCTVDAMTGKRFGEHCYYYEDIAAECQKFYNLSCGINNFAQFAFLFFLFFVPVLLVLSIVLFINYLLSIEKIERIGEEGKESKNQMLKYLDNLDELQKLKRE